MFPKRDRGRPPVDGMPKKHRLEVRLNDDEIDNIVDLSFKTGDSQSEVIRKALEFYRQYCSYRY